MPRDVPTTLPGWVVGILADDMLSLSALPWLLLIALSKRRKLHGHEVCVAGSAMEADEVFASVDAALHLIKRYDPALNEQIRSDVQRLLLTEASGGHYLESIRTCRIGIGYAKRRSPLELAMMIIHEATHARLAKAGLRYRGRQREQIERQCVDAEIGFAKRVPGSEEVITRTRRLLESRWWEAQPSSEDTIAELRMRGVPLWLAKALAKRAAKLAELE